jgi:hypothetical protein
MGEPNDSGGRREVDIEQLFVEGTAIDEAIEDGVRDALLDHKRAGNSIAIWKDEKVHWIPPEEIVIPDCRGRR